MRKVFFKQGVKYDLDGVVKIILSAQKVYQWYDQDVVITSLMDGEHMEGSKHYEGMAVDLRTFFFTREEVENVATDLHAELGEDYDVVVEPTHIHVEYDPK